jgi:ABC-type polysaccharide/polyol phosphate export permease
MPEDIPMAVLVLVWLLVGVITLGFLIMEYALIVSVVFAVIFYGVPVMWYANRKKKAM